MRPPKESELSAVNLATPRIFGMLAQHSSPTTYTAYAPTSPAAPLLPSLEIFDPLLVLTQLSLPALYDVSPVMRWTNMMAFNHAGNYDI
jgi:hypothetical protein